MLPPLVDLETFVTWVPDPVTNDSRAEAILTAASTLVRSETDRAWVGEDGEPEPDVSEVQLGEARSVVLEVAARVYFNPKGITQQVSGPFSKSVAAWYALGMSLSDEEKARVGIRSKGIRGLGTISTTRGELETPDVGFDDYDVDWRDLL
jgi:hypothetical protein